MATFYIHPGIDDTGEGKGTYPHDELSIVEPERLYACLDLVRIRVAMRERFLVAKFRHCVSAFVFPLQAGDPAEQPIESGLFGVGTGVRHEAVRRSFSPSAEGCRAFI